ncbi:MAG: DUF3047 domain-containing protein [Rubrivivax sp.]
MKPHSLSAWSSALVALVALAASVAQAATLAPFVGKAGEVPGAPWQFLTLPVGDKPPTRFRIVQFDGRRVLSVEADRSYGDLVQPLPGGTEARWLAWRWRLEEGNPAADLRSRSTDDRALQVCVAFDLPLAAVPFVERQFLRIASQSAGRTLPPASVCYVWDSRLADGTVLDDAFTRRVRVIVLHGAGAPLKTWFAERRDVRADFLRLFADEATQVPPVLAVVVSADADNTQGHSQAYVADLDFEP